MYSEQLGAYLQLEDVKGEIRFRYTQTKIKKGNANIDSNQRGITLQNKWSHPCRLSKQFHLPKVYREYHQKETSFYLLLQPYASL